MKHMLPTGHPPHGVDVPRLTVYTDQSESQRKGLMHFTRIVIAPVAVFSLALAACGGGTSNESSDLSEETTDNTSLLDDGLDQSTGAVAVSDAYAVNSPDDEENGVIYLTLTSEIDDAVIYADVDISTAAFTVLQEESTNDPTDTTVVERIDLPAGVAVEFKPGGFSIVLVGLLAPLVAGETVSVTLTLESGELVYVEAEIREG